jgi:raffinose/stachyose/melibiose transport system substrate-binding protein
MLNPFSRMTRPSRRRAIAIATVASAAAALTACSGGGSGDGRTTVSFLSWDSPQVMAPLIEAFEAAHPDIAVEVSSVADVSQYQTTLQPQLLSGTAPDVFILGSKAEQVGGGYVLDLTDEEFADRLSPANVQYASYEDKLYGVSIASWGGGFVLNNDILAGVGVSGPEDFPTNWDDYLKLLGKIEAAGHTPLLESASGAPATSLCALLGIENAAAGGNLDQQVFDGDATWASTWTPALEQWSRVFDEGYETRDVVGLAHDAVLQEFAQGDVGMVGIGSWAITQINDLDPAFDFTFVPVPGIEDGTSYLCGAAAPAWSVNAKSDVKEEALTFVEWLTTPEAAELFNQQTGSITTTAGYEPTLDPALDGIVDEVRAGDIYLPIVNWPQYADTLDAESIILLQRVIGGSIEPEDAAEGLDSKLAELQK